MSWDIYVQDLPPGISDVADIPDDFQPQPLGLRSEIIRKVLEVVPSADFSDPSRGQIEGRDFDIEVSMGESDVVECIALHVRGGDTAAAIVAAILRHLGFPALDTASDTGIFDLETATGNLRKWRVYRDQVLGPLKDTQ